MALNKQDLKGFPLNQKAQPNFNLGNIPNNARGASPINPRGIQAALNPDISGRTYGKDTLASLGMFVNPSDQAI
jgi:hypothetical protein